MSDIAAATFTSSSFCCLAPAASIVRRDRLAAGPTLLESTAAQALVTCWKN